MSRVKRREEEEWKGRWKHQRAPGCTRKAPEKHQGAPGRGVVGRPSVRFRASGELNGTRTPKITAGQRRELVSAACRANMRLTVRTSDLQNFTSLRVLSPPSGHPSAAEVQTPVQLNYSLANSTRPPRPFMATGTLPWPPRLRLEPNETSQRRLTVLLTSTERSCSEFPRWGAQVQKTRWTAAETGTRSLWLHHGRLSSASLLPGRAQEVLPSLVCPGKHCFCSHCWACYQAVLTAKVLSPSPTSSLNSNISQSRSPHICYADAT